MYIELLLFITMGLSFLYGLYFATKIYVGYLFGKEQVGEWPEKYTRQYKFLTYSNHLADDSTMQMIFKIYGNGVLQYEGTLEDCPPPLIIQLQNRYPFVNKNSSI